jgi:Ca2+/Na+ antiporter
MAILPRLTGPDMSRKKGPVLLLALSILLAVLGLAGFIYLFVLDFNVYWLFLAPVIIALYEIPAAFFFWLYKKKRAAADPEGKASGENPGPGQP